MNKGWHACHYCDGHILLEDTYYYEGDGDHADELQPGSELKPHQYYAVHLPVLGADG